VPGPGERASFDEAADELLAGAEPTTELSLLTLLRWIAQERGILFHGSQRDDLTALEPIRLTRDSTPFGDQQAVFAASDPVWAMYFATLRRGDGFRSTRNGSLGVPGSALARLAVSAADFPFAARVCQHRSDETMLTTVLRASRFGRGSP
jgi:hypothetical protein